MRETVCRRYLDAQRAGIRTVLDGVSGDTTLGTGDMIAYYVAHGRLRDAWGWGIAGGAVDIQKVNIASAMVGRRFDQRR